MLELQSTWNATRAERDEAVFSSAVKQGDRQPSCRRSRLQRLAAQRMM